MDPATPAPQIPNYGPDKEFWTPQASVYVGNKDPFSTSSSKPEYKRSREWLLDEFDSYLLHTKKKQAIEAPISNLESRINFFDSLPPDNPSISRSFPNQTAYNSSVSKKMDSYGGFEKVRDGWVKDPKSGWRTYVAPTLESKKTCIHMESPPCSNGGEEPRTGSVSFNAKCFGSYQEVMDALSRPVSSYSLLYEQSSVRTPKTPTKKLPNSVGSSSPCKTGKSRQVSANKIKADKKDAKKTAVAGFLTNVKTLLATRMFDGVPVRYISSSQEDLPGIIKGIGYLCGCQSCNYAKTLNAYEFERHASCKTSHPNNHIRFENGKSIHQVVQELKVTPRTMLFESIQTVTGASVNQTAFQAWKESFQATTCEHQGVYIEEEPRL